MPVGYKKEGSGAAFWLVLIFLAIAIAFGVWFFLKREEKPARANPSQSRMSAPIRSNESPVALLRTFGAG